MACESAQGDFACASGGIVFLHHAHGGIAAQEQLALHQCYGVGIDLMDIAYGLARKSA
jgi:hypothetical protein